MAVSLAPAQQGVCVVEGVSAGALAKLVRGAESGFLCASCNRFAFVLFLTLLSASAYKQSPMRQQQKALIQGEEKLSEQSMQPITESLDPATEQEPDAAKCGLRQA